MQYSRMENMDGNAWVFDSLVGFLHGPIWNVPLQTFIEEKSLPFEPTDDGEVPDRPEYKNIHREYRNLVDVMLGSFMDDIGITADQFEAACRLSARDLAGLPAHFHRRLFEQIWAANDYEMFVKMMTHKNVELQLQALELIESRYGAMPNIFSSESDFDSPRSGETEDWPDNNDVMTELKKLQLEELEIKEEEVVETVPPEQVVAEKKTLLSKLHSFDKKDEKPQAKAVAPDVIKPQDIVEPPKPPPKKVEVSEEEVRARQEYLKRQRDKLLALKKQVREKKLSAAEASAETGGGEGSFSHAPRPRSARVAQAALSGTPLPQTPDAMQLRKALASKLRTEVVDTEHSQTYV